MVMVEEQLPKRPGRQDPEKIFEQEFVEAVRRIYRRYGADVSALRRDIESDLAKRETSTVP